MVDLEQADPLLLREAHSDSVLNVSATTTMNVQTGSANPLLSPDAVQKSLRCVHHSADNRSRLQNPPSDTINALRDELQMVRLELQRKTDECKQLKTTLANVDTDIHDLTEKLFEEAYKMTADASRKQMKAEKLLAETEMKNDGLHAEVDMLKVLVKESAPSSGPFHRSIKRTAQNLFSKKAESPAKSTTGQEDRSCFIEVDFTVTAAINAPDRSRALP